MPLDRGGSQTLVSRAPVGCNWSRGDKVSGDHSIRMSFAFDPAARMDDAYSGNDQATERGLEEEDREDTGEPEEKNDQSDAPSSLSDSENTVDFFA